MPAAIWQCVYAKQLVCIGWTILDLQRLSPTEISLLHMQLRASLYETDSPQTVCKNIHWPIDAHLSSTLAWSEDRSQEDSSHSQVSHKCIYLTVTESQATDQMLLVLLRIEQTFGKLELISRKDLLIANLNPRIISEDHSRFLGIVQEVQHLADSQYRNYS